MNQQISIAFITFNRPDDALELLISILALKDLDLYVKDIVIVNNGSTVDYSTFEAFIDGCNNQKIVYNKQPNNIGATRGRNLAFTISKGEYLIMPDDDCVFEDTDMLSKLITEFNTKNTENEKAIIVFKVLYHSTREIQKSAFPHKNFEENKAAHWFETYFFAGCGCAYRRSSIEALDYFYPIGFFIYAEEYDLSFRLIDAGYSLVYTDKIVVLHKESPLGRKPKAEVQRMMWVNKSIVAYRYLPLKYFYSTAIMWSLEYLKNTSFNLSGFIKGWREIISISKKEKRLQSTMLHWVILIRLTQGFGIN